MPKFNSGIRFIIVSILIFFCLIIYSFRFAIIPFESNGGFKSSSFYSIQFQLILVILISQVIILIFTKLKKFIILLFIQFLIYSSLSAFSVPDRIDFLIKKDKLNATVKELFPKYSNGISCLFEDSGCWVGYYEKDYVLIKPTINYKGMMNPVASNRNYIFTTNDRFKWKGQMENFVKVKLHDNWILIRPKTRVFGVLESYSWFLQLNFHPLNAPKSYF